VAHPARVKAHAAASGQGNQTDPADARAAARLLRGGNFPLAYAYSQQRRGLRDLLRARLRLVPQRAAPAADGSPVAEAVPCPPLL